MSRPAAPVPSESPPPGITGPLGAAQFGQMLDSSSVIIAVKDLEGRYVYVNRPFARLLDGDPAQFIGHTDTDLFPERLARRLRGNDHQVLADGRTRSFEERMVIEGQPMIFDTRKFPLRDDDGRITGLCLMATNVTTQRRTARALESIALSVSAATGSEVFDLIVKSLASALEVDFAFIARITEQNPRTLQALSAWFQGKPVTPPWYRAAGTPCDDVLVCGYTWISRELQQRYPGDEMMFEFDFHSYAGFPLTDSAGNAIGVLSVCHTGPLPDAELVEHLLRIFSVRAIAELERADTESALRASEASYRTIFESAEDAIFVHDIDTGAIVDVNRKACEVYGYSREEMLALDTARLSSGIPPYTGENAAACIARARDGQPQRLEWHRRNKDGSLHWDEVTLSRVALSGVDRILAVTREVTERKEQEAQLRQAQKMEAIGHLAGGIAHDFNNILTGVVGYLGLARQRLDGKDPTVEDYLRQAADSAGRATELVRQLLTFSRGRVGKPESLDLGGVVRRSTTLLRSTLSSSVKLEFQLSDRVPPVWMDPVQAEQILLNLCINARDAMDGRGRIVIRLRPVRVRRQHCSACQQPVSGERVELSVSDSGHGIEASILDRIFEPFYSTKPTGQGSGMGLAIVHGIVHEHQGHIRVATAADTGTTFRILLPVHRGQPGIAGPVSCDAIPDTPLHGHVMVVDDEEVVGRYMTELLAEFGLESTRFSTPRDALDALPAMEPPPDCVVADYTMPELNGLEFIARLRETFPGLPALIYSGYPEQIDTRQVGMLGLPLPLHKPVDPAELYRALCKILRPRDPITG